MNNKTLNRFFRGSVVLALGIGALHMVGCAGLRDFSLTYDDARARSNQVVVTEMRGAYFNSYARMGDYVRYAPDVYRDGGAMNRAVPRNQRAFGH